MVSASASYVKYAMYTLVNEPVSLYFLNSLGANQRLSIQSSIAFLAVEWSTWNGSTPSTARRSGASCTSSRWIGVAQYGQRVAVRVPVKVVWPPQLWQTISFSPANCWTPPATTEAWRRAP